MLRLQDSSEELSENLKTAREHKQLVKAKRRASLGQVAVIRNERRLSLGDLPISEPRTRPAVSNAGDSLRSVELLQQLTVTSAGVRFDLLRVSPLVLQGDFVPAVGSSDAFDLPLPNSVFDAEPAIQRQENSETHMTDDKPTQRPSGHRLVNLDRLNAFFSQNSVCGQCRTGQLVFASEKHEGLASSIRYTCTDCPASFVLHTSDKIRLKPTGPPANELNVRAVLGTMCVGNGYAHLEQFVTNLGSPTLGKPAFYGLQRSVASRLQEAKERVIAGNIAAERRAAIQAGHTPDENGRLPVSVSYDGFWPKRCVGVYLAAFTLVCV